jgi:hypothetical protein
MIEIKTEPSAMELRVFALLWAVFWLVLGRIAPAAGEGLAVAAAVTGGCLVLSLLLNREVTGRERVWGLAFPVGLVAFWMAGRAVGAGAGEGSQAPLVLWAAGGLVGIVGAVVVLGSRRRGIAIYRAWMLAAMPIGWVLSHALLAAVFYGVVLPVGLAMRLAGRDPMTRRLDRAAASYWVGHERVGESKRYFKQS